MIPGGSFPSSERDQQIARIIADCSDRVNSGKLVESARIVAEHPHLAPELEIALDALLSFESTTDYPTSMIGRRLGDFRILGGVGRGGMGVVYEARQESLDRRVALKVLPSALLGRDSAVRRFVREARVAARLQHPNVVTTFGMGIESEIPYFAMELVKGRTLAELLARQQDPTAKNVGNEKETVFDTDEIELEYCLEAARLFAGVAEGLQHAHAHGVVHRDIKPSNLILDEGGRLRILDFGLARLEGQDHLTLSGDLIGTPLYMSPEQAARRKINVSAPSDIYSLGATLFETLTHQAPFRGDDFQETLHQIINDEPISPRKLQPRIPAPLETIILKCLMKEPRDRYLTAEALAQDLMRFARGDAIEARPQSRFERTVRRLERHRIAFLVGGVILALLFSLTVLFFSHRNQDRLRRKAEYAPLVTTAAQQMQFRHHANGLEGTGALDFETQAFFGGVTSLTEFIGTDQRELALHAVADLTKACDLLPDRPEGHYHRAKAFLILGRQEDAVRDLKIAESSDPSFVPALMLRATIREMEGDKSTAQELLDQAETRASTPWSRSWVQAQLAVREQAWSRAADHFSRLITLEGEGEQPYLGFSVDSRLGRGIARLWRKDYDGAIDDFVYARAHWPDAVEPGLLLGRAYLNAEEPRRAARIFQKLFEEAAYKDEVSDWIAITYCDHEDYDAALLWIERVEDDFLLSKGKAFISISLERYREAMEAADDCITLQPESSIGYLLKGLALYKRDHLLHPERLQLSFNMEMKAVEVEPNNPAARCGFGVALVESQQLDAGIAMLKSSLAIAEGNLVALFYIGKALGLKGDLTAAARSYLDAIDLAPDFTDAWAGLAGIRFNQGKIEEARTIVDKVLVEEPENLVALITQASILTLDKSYQEATEILERVVVAAPYDLHLRERLASLLEQSGNDEEAIRQYRTLSRMHRNRADYLASLGKLHVRQGNVSHAIASFQKAIEIDGSVAAYHRDLGKVLADAGDTLEAHKAYQKSLEINPNQPDLRDLIRILESKN